MVHVKEESSANDTITPNDIEMLFTTEDVGNNVTICHDADVSEPSDGNVEVKVESANSDHIMG